MKSFSMEIQELALWDKLRSKRIPFSFDIEVTARCNCNCRHCYICVPAQDRQAKGAELTAAEIDDIAGQAVSLGAIWCLITGGEPLLRADFEDIYLRLKRRGLLVSVFTNATLLSAAHIALFSKYPPRDIEVTVYGASRETYERVTQTPGSYDHFMRGLNLLMQSGVKVRLKAMAVQSNFREQAAIAAFCRQRTKDYFRFDPQLHLRFDRDEARNKLICAERLRPEQIVALEASDAQRLQVLKNNCKTLINEDFCHIGCNHLFHCGAGNGSFYVGPDGTFRLCSSLWAPATVCDLRQGSLARAWNDFVPQVRQMGSDRQQFLDTCRVCPLINLCLWCPAHAYLETGELDGATPYFCQVAHARAEALGHGHRCPI